MFRVCSFDELKENVESDMGVVNVGTDLVALEGCVFKDRVLSHKHVSLACADRKCQ